MKKICTLSLVIFLLVIVLVSCHSPTDTSQSISTTEALDQPPPYQAFLMTYDELQSYVMGNNQQGVIEGQVLSKALNEFFSLMAQKQSPPMPRINGKELTLYQEHEFPGLTFFEYEAFGAPWMWFHCLYKGNYMRVRLTYIDAFEVENADKKDVVKFIKAVQPDSANVDNFDDNEKIKEVFDQIKSIQLTVSGETVLCIWYDLKETHSGKSAKFDWFAFLYDEYYIVVDANPEHLDKEFWDGFSIG